MEYALTLLEHAKMGLQDLIEATQCALVEIVNTRYVKIALVDVKVDGKDTNVGQRSTTYNENSEV